VIFAVFVYAVERTPINVTTEPDWPRYVGGTWSARGVVISDGQRVSWDQHRMNDPIPDLGSIVQLHLEPETWRVVP
jgi:hypothetical protein